MAKHRIQNLVEQIANKGHGSAPFHYGTSSFQENEPLGYENIQKKGGADNNSIQLRAYHIYQERGGSELDNWLEAEQFLKNEDRSSSNFINEGNPNTQR